MLKKQLKTVCFLNFVESWMNKVQKNSIIKKNCNDVIHPCWIFFFFLSTTTKNWPQSSNVYYSKWPMVLKWPVFILLSLSHTYSIFLLLIYPGWPACTKGPHGRETTSTHSPPGSTKSRRITHHCWMVPGAVRWESAYPHTV